MKKLLAILFLPLLLASCTSSERGGEFSSSTSTPIVPLDTAPKNYGVGSGTPELLADLAVIHHPELAALRARANRLRAKARGDSALPDPSANLALGNMAETAAGQVDAMLGVSQKVPYPGKRKSIAQAGQLEADAVLSDLAARALNLREQVKSVWWDLYLAEQTITFSKENRALLTSTQSIIKSMAETNKASQADQLRIANELTKIDRDLTDFQGLRQSAKARLNSLLNRPAGASIPQTSAPNLPATANLQTLLARAEKNQPSLLAARQRIAAQQEKLNLAELAKYPDFTFGIQHAAIGSDGLAPMANGRDQLYGTIGITIPWSRAPRQAMKDEAASAIAETSALLDVEKSNLRYRIEDAYVRAKTARQITSLFEQKLIPNARQAQDVTLSAYASGTATFTQVIDTQRELLTYQLQLVRNRAQLGKALATLEAAAASKF